MLHFLDGVAPAAVASLLKVILSNVYEHVFPALPLSLLVLLWSSAKAFSELLKGMAAMAGSGHASGYLKRRLRAILLTAALLLTLIVSLSMLIFGARVSMLLGALFPRALGLLALLVRLRYIFMALPLWLLFLFLYRSIPGRRPSLRAAQTGALLATGAWIGFSALFSLYADRFLDLTLYGSMATMALTMLWLFYCQYIVLVGAGLCAGKKEAVSLKTTS